MGIYCSLVARRAAEESCVLGSSSQEMPPRCLPLPLLALQRSFCFSSSHVAQGT